MANSFVRGGPTFWISAHPKLDTSSEVEGIGGMDRRILVGGIINKALGNLKIEVSTVESVFLGV